MKNILFLLLTSVLLLTTACEKDPYALSLEKFDVRWFDDDNTGTQTPGDALQFSINVQTTDPDEDDQHITEWEFSYSVNDHFAGVLDGDENIRSNSLNFDAEVFIDQLLLPGPGSLHPGDVIEFRMWARDNHGIELEQFHRFVLEN